MSVPGLALKITWAKSRGLLDLMDGCQDLASCKFGLKLAGLARLALLGSFANSRSASATIDAPASVSALQLAGFGQRGQLAKGAVRSVRPDGLRKIRVTAERLLDLVVKPIEGFRIGVNALPFAVFVVTGTGCDGDELNRGRRVAFLDPPREAMAFEGVGERRARLVFRNLAVEGDVETKHVVGGLARVLFAPVGGEIGDGFLAGDEAPVFALERQFSLVALVVHQRRGAHGTGAVAREFDDGGL